MLLAIDKSTNGIPPAKNFSLTIVVSSKGFATTQLNPLNTVVENSIRSINPSCTKRSLKAKTACFSLSILSPFIDALLSNAMLIKSFAFFSSPDIFFTSISTGKPFSILTIVIFPLKPLFLVTLISFSADCLSSETMHRGVPLNSRIESISIIKPSFS